MKRKPLHELGDLQRAVMETVWEKSEATVHQVRDALRTRKRPAYTTVLSVLQKLEKAGWITHRRDGRNYVYLPRRSREDEGKSALRRFVDRVFAGDPLVAFQHMLEDERLDDEDFAALRLMIDRTRKEGGRRG